MTTEEILEWLDAEFPEEDMGRASFDVLEDYSALADARLSAFRGDEMWAIAIEAVRFDAKLNDYILDVYLLSNCFKTDENLWGPDAHRILFTTPRAWNPWMLGDNPWNIDRAGFALHLRGQRFDFAPSLEALEAAGVRLSKREQASRHLTPPQMLRYVCHALDHPFFLSEDALRALLDDRALPFEWKYDEATKRQWWENEIGEFDESPILSVCLELLVQTRDWRHPQWRTDDEPEKSPRVAFAPLVQTLATGDLSKWQSQDPATFNSHWRFWADTEADAEDSIAATAIIEREQLHSTMLRLPPESRAQVLENLRGLVIESGGKHAAPAGLFGVSHTTVTLKSEAFGEVNFSITTTLLKSIDAIDLGALESFPRAENSD